ncbi:MAG: glycosyl transferase group 1 [Bacteroidota bacterium]|nr:glycosyl transferase group 1 [Bacteroidota bacterium]
MRNSLSDKKIIIFLDTLLMGGAEKQAILLAGYLKNTEKSNVEVWAIDRAGKGAELLDELGVPWKLHSLDRYAGKLKRIKELIKLIIAIRKFKPDIIMPFTYWPNVICCAIWNFTGAKTCVWNQRDEGRGSTNHVLEKYALKKTPVFVSNSEEGRLFLAKHLDVDKHKVRLIHNSVNLPAPLRPKQYWRDTLKISEKHFVATMIANLHGYKDHKTLLDAWKIVCDSTKDKIPLLFLAGRFDHKYYELKLHVQALNIKDNVRFLDQVDDIAGLLSVTDLGVFSSRFEGCPNGVLECMNSGLSVVATDIIGIREALGDDYPYLASISDHRTFANHILTFVNSADLREKIALQNRQRADQEFSPNKMFSNYASLIESVL